MPRRRAEEPHWVRYEVRYLIMQHVSAWEEFRRERDRLQVGPLGHSPSEMHRANHARPRMETTSKLLDMALKAVGPVRLDGRLYKNSMSAVSEAEMASADVQDATGLFVEIISPMNGMARKVE